MVCQNENSLPKFPTKAGPTETQINIILDLHNKYRKIHEAQPLKYDSKISKIAQNYANKLIESGEFEHSCNKYSGQQLGENLAKWKGTALNFDGSKAVEAWYDEINQYDFRSNLFEFSTGHFSQLVWKQSKLLGIGLARKGNNVVVVCNYWPPGNFDGEFLKNVSPKRN